MSLRYQLFTYLLIPNANFLHSVLQCDFHHHPMSPLHSSRCRILLRFHHNCSQPTVIGLVKVYCSPLSKGLLVILPMPRHDSLPLWVVPLHPASAHIEGWASCSSNCIWPQRTQRRMHLISERLDLHCNGPVFTTNMPSTSCPRNFTSGSRKWFPGKPDPQHYFLGNSACLTHLDREHCRWMPYSSVKTRRHKLFPVAARVF